MKIQMEKEEQNKFAILFFRAGNAAMFFDDVPDDLGEFPGM